MGISDRSRPGRAGQERLEIHILSGADGIALVTAVTSAYTYDGVMVQPMVTAVRSRRGPRRRKAGRLWASKGYDRPVHPRWLRERGIVTWIARRGVNSSERLGRYRWKLERTLAPLTGYRRLAIRYERYGSTSPGFFNSQAR